jgi:hypothetical protein
MNLYYNVTPTQYGNLWIFEKFQSQKWLSYNDIWAICVKFEQENMLAMQNNEKSRIIVSSLDSKPDIINVGCCQWQGFYACE